MSLDPTQGQMVVYDARDAALRDENVGNNPYTRLLDGAIEAQPSRLDIAFDTVGNVTGVAGEAVQNGVAAFGRAVADAENNDANLGVMREAVDGAVNTAVEYARRGLDTVEGGIKTGAQFVYGREINMKPFVAALNSLKDKVAPESSLEGASSVKAALINGVRTYVEKKGQFIIGAEKFTRSLSEGSYNLTKMVLFPLTLCRPGRVLVEALATVVAAVTRVASSVVAAVLAFLPELTVLAGLVSLFALTGGVGGAAIAGTALTTLKGMGIAAAVLAGVGYIVRNEIMHKQNRDAIAEVTQLVREGHAENVKANLEVMDKLNQLDDVFYDSEDEYSELGDVDEGETHVTLRLRPEVEAAAPVADEPAAAPAQDNGGRYFFNLIGRAYDAYNGNN